MIYTRRVRLFYHSIRRDRRGVLLQILRFHFHRVPRESSLAASARPRGNTRARRPGARSHSSLASTRRVTALRVSLAPLLLLLLLFLSLSFLRSLRVRRVAASS